MNRTLAHVPPWTASFSFFRPTLLQLVNNSKDLYERVQTAAVAMPWDVVVGAVILHAAGFGVWLARSCDREHRRLPTFRLESRTSPRPPDQVDRGGALV